MGREIRRVPANYQHPQVYHDYSGEMRDVSMYDKIFEQATAEWDAKWLEWKSGVRPSYYEKDDGDDTTIAFFSEYHGLRPNDPSEYRSWSDKEATWYQVWQTVSEGSPVSPPFATQEELISYLADNGDFWDQKRCQEPDWSRLYGGTPGVSAWGRPRAEAFVKSSWAPSMAFIDGSFVEGSAVPLALSKTAA